VFLKTRRDRFAQLRAKILELHPYEVPEVIAVSVDQGHEAYLDWIIRETG
jgi:periplasmic divalent cation tolerance protein